MRNVIILALCCAGLLALLAFTGCTSGGKLGTSPDVTLTATPATAPAGGPVRLRWVSPRGSHLVSSNFSAPAPCGERVVSPSVTSTYYVVIRLATGYDVQAPVTVTIDPSAAVPPTVTLSADSTSVGTGSAVTLTWASTHADTVGTSDFSATDVNGTTTVHPTVSGSYSITVSGPGGTATATTGVAVHSSSQTNTTDGAQMVFVPAGAFIMGDSLADPSWGPTHSVNLNGYWIYQHEVTVAQYRAYHVATGVAMPPMPSWGQPDSFPITNVTWAEAKAYADWAGAQLPTEAQWEKAARGSDGRTYPWGDTWEPWDAEKCDDATTGTGYAVSVGSYPQGASPYGAVDMLGNAWEWCSDWYASDYYATAPVLNPIGPPSGKAHVLRGGGCLFYGTVTPSCALRRTVGLDSTMTQVAIDAYRQSDFGFRCVVPAP